MSSSPVTQTLAPGTDLPDLRAARDRLRQLRASDGSRCRLPRTDAAPEGRQA